MISNVNLFLYIYHIIFKSSAGVYNYLPLGQQVLHRLTGFIDDAMQEIDGAMRVKLAHLQPKSLWDRTGRADLIGDEVIKSFYITNQSINQLIYLSSCRSSKLDPKMT